VPGAQPTGDDPGVDVDRRQLPGTSSLALCARVHSEYGARAGPVVDPGGAMSTESSQTQRRRSPEAETLARRLAQAKKLNWHRTLILGAGASRAAGLPNFGELCKKLIEKFNIPHDGNSAIASVKQYYAESGNDPVLDIPAVLPTAKPTIGYLHLAQLLEKEVFDLVLSTNWDPLVELALADMAPAHRCQVLIRKQVDDSIITGYLQRPPAANLLIKLHGDISAQLFLAITEEEITHLDENMERELGTWMRGQVVIVGHSLGDPDIAGLLENRGGPGGGVTYVTRGQPDTDTTDVLARIGIGKDQRITGESGGFDNFFSDLHVAYEESQFGDDKKASALQIMEIRDACERGTNYLNNAATREKVAELLGKIRDISPDLVLFLHDETAPGGSEIQRWMRQVNLGRRSRAWQEARVAVDRPGGSRTSPLAPEIRLTEAMSPLMSKDKAVNNIVLVDSCAFSGKTMLAAGKKIRETIRTLPRVPEIQLSAVLLALHPYAQAQLQEALDPEEEQPIFDQVEFVVELKRHEITLPWGTTELTSTLRFGIPGVDGAALEVRGKIWGISEVLGEEKIRTNRINTVRPGGAFSFHRHLLRSELFVPLDDGLRLELSPSRPTSERSNADADFTSIMLEKMQPVLVSRGLWHRIVGPRQQEARVAEVGFGLYDEAADHDVARVGFG